MENKTAAVFFSPGGTTRLAAETAAAAFGSFDSYDFTSRAQKLSFGPDDAVIFASPVFGGRVPEVFVRFLDSVSGSGTPAVVLAVYGARAYEDALLELADTVEARGFSVVAGGAFVARHSIATELAAGRPNEADIAAMAALGEAAKAKIASGSRARPELPGTRPYRPFPGGTPTPSVNRQRCVKCGKCAAECPVGAIPADTPWKTDSSRCIGCMHCVYACPNYARGLNPVLLAAVRTMLKKACSGPKPPETFV